MKFLDYVEQASNICDKEENKKINIAILRSYTCENIDPILKVELYKLGFNSNIEYGIYNQYYQEALDDQSFIYKNNIDIVIILIKPQDLFAKIFENENSPILQVNLIDNMINNIKEKSKVKAIIFLNMEEYQEEVNGILEYNTLNSITSKLKKFNLELLNLREKYNTLYLIDINKINYDLGMLNVHNNKMKYISKDPYKPEFYIELSKKIARIINRIFNPCKKVLILDLDNTLYKGILSEDGIETITNFEEYPNAHYKNLQIKIKNLKNRGILLCLATKNDYSDVEKLFNTDKMHLKLNDFTIIKANWEDKYKNIMEISNELNLDFNSFVFVDDNPYEIEMINKMLPQIETLNISTKPEEAEHVLDKVYFFDTLSITEEDKNRAELYKQNVKFNLEKVLDIETFLNDLKMEVEFKILNNEDITLIERASQMTLKTNQFNMTTKRYSVEDIKKIIKEPENTVVMMFVEDKFGNHGSTGLVILKSNEIDTFLLSCRVLKRNLEYAMLNFAKDIVKNKLQEKEMISKYIPTPKNTSFKSFYLDAGMTEIKENIYKIDVINSINKVSDYIKIKKNFDTVYGLVDKTRNLTLLQNGKKIQLMNNKQLLELAEKIVHEIKKTNIKTIVVSESGATPLVKVCSQITHKKNIDIEWFYFKTPRQNDINLYEMIKFYLSEEEQNVTRLEALKQHCKNIDLKKYLPLEEIKIEEVLSNINQKIENLDSLDDILRGTKIYEIFSQPFIFFDEYILSGTIIRNFNFYANLICKNVDYRLGTYMIIANNIELYKNIAFSIYSLENELEAYENGVYPFEDRIDLIGYFYYITNDYYMKINIKDFIKTGENKQNELNKFIREIYQFIDEYEILKMLKEKCRKKDLKEYFTEEDIVRYILKILEERTTKKSLEATFLNESFELYSPIWFPMPKEYHYEYWKTFVKIQYLIDEFIDKSQEKYINIREFLINKLAQLLNKI